MMQLPDILDLLFYHRILKRLVAIELKLGKKESNSANIAC